MTQGTCRRHHLEIEDDECASCGHGYCTQCLVYVHGPQRPPMCVMCALARAGIRSGSRPRRRGVLARRRENRVRREAEAVMEKARTEAQEHANGIEIPMLPVLAPAPVTSTEPWSETPG